MTILQCCGRVVTRVDGMRGLRAGGISQVASLSGVNVSPHGPDEKLIKKSSVLTFYS